MTPKKLFFTILKPNGCLFVWILAGLGQISYGEDVEIITEISEIESAESLLESTSSDNSIVNQISTLELALEWLAEQQDADGSWDSTKYDGQMNPYASTAIALLPFLGAGHCEMAGKYRKKVRQGINYLNEALVDSTVSKKSIQADFLSTCLVLQTLSETSIFGSSPTTKKNANELAQRLMEQYKKQMLENSGLGFQNHGHNIVWFILAIKSAEAADLPYMLGHEAKDCYNIFKHYLAIETAEWMWHLDVLTTNPTYQEAQKTWGLMFINQFMGMPSHDPFLQKASEATCALFNNSEWVESENMKNAMNVLFLTYAAFQQNGKLWDEWNPRMKTILITTQHKEDTKVLRGSWDPVGVSDTKIGGRFFATAMSAMCSEVFHCY
jgi:hypothetical protein